MTTFADFKGERKPLDAWDIPELAYRINVSEDHLQAFLNVESRSTGFGREGRPIILNEPHVFYRNLSGAAREQAVADGLAYPKWGSKPYPRSQDERYEWLKKAMRIDQSAALKSCSWGSTQILGENYSLVGYASPEQMVIKFMDDEEEHVEAMVKYILATGIDDDLRNERWSTVARIYNGPSYKKNGYHTKMAQEFAKLRGIADVDWQSDEDEVEYMIPDASELKTIQKRLRELGYTEVGTPDGIWGTKTRAAILGFRSDNGLALVPGVTDDLMAALMLAKPREISEARKNATATELRKEGSRTISAADKTTGIGALVGIGGALTAAQDALDGVQEQIEGLSGMSEALDGLMGSLSGVSPYLLVLLGGYVIYQQLVVKKSRVEDHQTGKHAGPGS